ncbi:MAG: secondary thiamine-phosphate synthase enzyme YjbQ [Candidatus Aenigmatarchaeota archaeon]
MVNIKSFGFMEIDTKKIEMKTSEKFQLIDVTDQVKDIFEDSNIKDGFVTIFSPHTTCAVKINEREDSLLEDFEDFLEQIAPRNVNYGHNETCVDDRPNAHSHLRSLVLNASETVPVVDGELLLGGWQTVFFIELDGPREKRRLIVQILGE